VQIVTAVVQAEMQVGTVDEDEVGCGIQVSALIDRDAYLFSV
jgi:hypothetical protein